MFGLGFSQMNICGPLEIREVTRSTHEMMELKKKVNDTIEWYDKFLKKTQEFITLTKRRAMAAQSLNHMCEAIEMRTLQTLTDDVQSLLKEFRSLRGEINAKLTEQDSLTRFFNLTRGNFLLDVAKILVGRKEENLFMQIGETILKNLLDIGKEQTEIKGKHNGLNRLGGRSAEQEMRIVSNEKKELHDILDKTEVNVNKGFKIIEKR